MNEVLSKTIQVNGRDVRYYTAGHGDPLVVLHGGGGDARTWLGNISPLAEKYTVYVPDLPGYGGSQALEGRYFIPELSAFLDGFTRSLGLETFYLMGHSLGGGIALKFALDFPLRITKMVLISSLCLGNEIAFWVRLLSIPALLKSVGAVVISLFKGIKWVFEKLNPVEYVPPMSPASVYVGGAITTFRRQSLVLEKRLPEVGVPTLLVWGARDNIVPVAHAYRAAEAMPRAQVKVFDKVGHDVHRDELAGFSRTVSGFLG